MIETFYFGETAHQLLGIYHPPAASQRNDAGIILCQPVGQEYMRAHRSFVHLARSLAGSGFHVLKFDYSSCGDSAGACEAADVERWRSDTLSAVQEIAVSCALRRIWLVGLRLGATLAAMAYQTLDRVNGLVLWEPIIQGRKYLEELRHMHGEWLRGSFSKPPCVTDDPGMEEILGFPLTPGLCRQLEQIDLLAPVTMLPRCTLLIESNRNAQTASFLRRLQERQCDVDYQCREGPIVWAGSREGHNGLVSPVVLQCIEDWLVERDGECQRNP